MGVDQIIGAKLVDATGSLVDANDEILRGIRGGGGIFGAIVELEIKVYALQEVSPYMISFNLKKQRHLIAVTG